jgi:hypothetical protein
LSEDRRVALVEGAIKAFNEQDFETLVAFIHPDVTSRVSAELGNPGTWHGVEGYLAMMADWGEAWSENLSELEQVELVDDTMTFVHTRQTLVGAGSGVPVAFGAVFLVDFEGDRAIRFEIHPDRDSAVEAL